MPVKTYEYQASKELLTLENDQIKTTVFSKDFSQTFSFLGALTPTGKCLRSIGGYELVNPWLMVDIGQSKSRGVLFGK